MENYKTLEKVFKKLNSIGQAKSILHWDMATKMPNLGADARIEQLKTLSDIYNAILQDDSVGDLIEDAGTKGKKLNDWQKANLTEMKRTRKHIASVPKKLSADLIEQGSKCEILWREARAANDFAKLKPQLKKVVDIVRKIATVKSEAFGCSKYDALLDQYDPDRKSEQIDKVFESLQEFLPEFTKKVVEKQAEEKISNIKPPFDIECQKNISKQILDILGFSFDKGRLDVSHHPFCGGYKSDIRITTRYDENDFVSSLMGVIHEAGHAFYEDGLPAKWQDQPVGQSRGMSIHESQSLLLEMQACRSREFIGFLSPILKKAFNSKSRGWATDNLYKLYNKVTPSLIRVEADEVTYPSHVMLRYYIEKYLINDEMEVEDLPEAWNQGMEKFLGVKPKNDKDGCMQDIHWMDGTFGYFPTYTIGAIYSAQLFKSATEKHNDILPAIAKGNFNPLKTWLNKNVHELGSTVSSDEIIKRATGEELNVEIYKEHLTKRYLEG